MAAAASLAPGDWLRVVHRREPHLLYPLLERGGFSWHTRPGGDAGYEIFIWRQGDPEAERHISLGGER